VQHFSYHARIADRDRAAIYPGADSQAGNCFKIFHFLEGNPSGELHDARLLQRVLGILFCGGSQLKTVR
jgi:hypothetical protein